MAEKIITQEYLHELFNYQDGDLIRKKFTSNRVKIGDKAGSLNVYGYKQTHINGKIYLNHRLIFMYVYGYMPNLIDHINGNKSDNRIENLRECNKSQNAMNAKLKNSNTSGYKNVYWNKLRNSYEVKLNFNNQTKHLGYYKQLANAINVAQEARNIYHKNFANDGKK
jgi:hypothetical protein